MLYKDYCYKRGEDFQVYIRRDTLRVIYEHVLQGLKGNQEVAGVLVGKYLLDKDKKVKFIELVHALQARAGQSSSIDVSIPSEEWFRLIDKVNNSAKYKGVYTISGWYHSHPGLSLFLSQTDIINQLGYQVVNPKAIALVFDHTKIISKDPPVALFQLNNPLYGASTGYHEVEYYIGGINKKNELEMIKDLYNEIESDVIAKRLPSIEKSIAGQIKDWRKQTKVKLSKKQIYEKRKKGGLKKTLAPYFE